MILIYQIKVKTIRLTKLCKLKTHQTTKQKDIIKKLKIF